MNETKATPLTEIQRYLETGGNDVLFLAWSGDNTVDRLNRGDRELRDALVDEVNRRAASCQGSPVRDLTDLADVGRRKAASMVQGLFPQSERDTVLALLERSVRILAPDNVESVLRDCQWLNTAWRLANMYLNSLGAEPLSDQAPAMLGYSEETTCFVSLEYFDGGSPFADYIVHEMAHVFHNCKRRTAGLKQTRTREWLLDIDFHKRETFAYACEAYSRILEQTANAAERRVLADRFDGFESVNEDRIDSTELASLVRQACERRNGWKVILAHCKPPDNTR